MVQVHVRARHDRNPTHYVILRACYPRRRTLCRRGREGGQALRRQPPGCRRAWHSVLRRRTAHGQRWPRAWNALRHRPPAQRAISTPAGGPGSPTKRRRHAARVVEISGGPERPGELAAYVFMVPLHPGPLRRVGATQRIRQPVDPCHPRDLSIVSRWASGPLKPGASRFYRPARRRVTKATGRRQWSSADAWLQSPGAP